MSTVAPNGRTDLSADALVGWVRSGFADLPASRPRDTDRAGTEALRAAVALGSRTSPARLAFDTDRPEDHGERLDGLERVPWDPHRRALRDPVSPASLWPFCQRLLRQLQRGKALAPTTVLAGHGTPLHP
jgi:hypothetical protein